MFSKKEEILPKKAYQSRIEDGIFRRGCPRKKCGDEAEDFKELNVRR